MVAFVEHLKYLGSGPIIKVELGKTVSNMKKLIVANWKMNLTKEKVNDFIVQLSEKHKNNPFVFEKSELVICAPYIYLTQLSALQKDNAFSIGAQDCSAHQQGAFTGEISAQMIKDAGCSFVIAGHSERRQYHCEDNALVKKKAISAFENKLRTIICVGETQEQRDKNIEQEVVERQIRKSLPENAHAGNVIIAYEPVWAIGTGKTPAPSDVEKMHNLIRSILTEHYDNGFDIAILYGGSMKPDNAAELLSINNVNGGLIGGASLEAEKFFAIAQKA